VPPTHKETHSHYVYFLTMNDENKVERMVKVWNGTLGYEGTGLDLILFTVLCESLGVEKGSSRHEGP
jgi:hypothetical protein